MTRSPDDLVARARRHIGRFAPETPHGVAGGGGLVVDIRPEVQRVAQGHLDGAAVIERNVSEWRLDPSGGRRIPEVPDHRQQTVGCTDGFASSLAAASLAEFGSEDANDLGGGYRAWRSWVDATGGPS